MGETMGSTANRHARGPIARSLLRASGWGPRSCIDESVSESHVQRLPFARRAKNTRGVVVGPSPTSALTIAAHSVIARLPARDHLARGGVLHPSRVDVCPPRNGALHRGCRPSAPRLAMSARLEEPRPNRSEPLDAFVASRGTGKRTVRKTSWNLRSQGRNARLRFRETHPRARTPLPSTRTNMRS